MCSLEGITHNFRKGESPAGTILEEINFEKFWFHLGEKIVWNDFQYFLGFIKEFSKGN